MSKLLLAAAAALLLGTATASADDTCYPAVTGKTKSKYKQATMSAAYHEAILAWDVAAEKKYQDDFDWNYSGDRTISCKWKTGKDILCTATARPCTQ
jgi:hypothetical protein